MSGSRETVEEIERNNVMCARRVAEYWRRQAVKVELAGDQRRGHKLSSRRMAYRAVTRVRMRYGCAIVRGNQTHLGCPARRVLARALGDRYFRLLPDQTAAERRNEGQCLCFAAEPQANCGSILVYLPRDDRP